MKVPPWHGRYLVEELWYCTVQGLWVQVALNAFHVPFRFKRIELPNVGWLKYA